MGSCEFVAVAATRSRLEERLSHGKMTKGCPVHVSLLLPVAATAANSYNCPLTSVSLMHYMDQGYHQNMGVTIDAHY